MTNSYLSDMMEKINTCMLNMKKGDIKEDCPIGIVDIESWEWPQGVALYCEYLHYQKTKDPAKLAYLIRWFETHLREGIPERNVNTTAPMLTMACLYEETGDEKWLTLCKDWAEWVMREMARTEEGGLQHIVTGGVNEQQLWDDTLFMTVLFLAKMSVILNNEEYRQEAVYQFLLHAKYLYDTRTGLWFHGWTFLGRNNFAGALWARGNCWITAGIPIFIEMVHLEGAEKRFLTELLRAQVKALAALQAPSGLWHTLLDDPDSYEEASAVAGFAFGIMKGIRMGLLPEEYRPTAEKALHGVLDCVLEDGTVDKVSYGTGMGSTFQHYRDIPIYPMAYGQSLALLMLHEFME